MSAESVKYERVYDYHRKKEGLRIQVPPVEGQLKQGVANLLWRGRMVTPETNSYIVACRASQLEMETRGDVTPKQMEELVKVVAMIIQCNHLNNPCRLKYEADRKSVAKYQPILDYILNLFNQRINSVNVTSQVAAVQITPITEVEYEIPSDEKVEYTFD